MFNADAHIFEMFRVKEILLSQFQQHVYVVTNCVLCADKFRLFLLTVDLGLFFFHVCDHRY